MPRSGDMQRNKYKVAPVEERRALGRTFASKAEKEYALMLEDWVEIGIIQDYVCQPKVWLGCHEYTYTPDFLVIPDGAGPHYVDVKGMETTSFKRTKKLWSAHGRLPLHVVKKRGKKFETSEVLP
tara:strand:- start:3131 stop:3505 length:375 start_codon:yes stop_codon:yes gene_type:complete